MDINVTYCDHHAICGVLTFILFHVLQLIVTAIQTYQVGVTLLLFNAGFLRYTGNVYTTFIKMIVSYSGK